MPLVRYEIRNEYSLANPELYRSAGKDDSEALLEGVAMAGLVGIVRQLGDLAEFAAEIFHDLHEEVMATAARGHGLMIRVQQLEAEFPSIEKALMSENNQLRFAYAMGGDWHASIRNDQNHLTQGDLPRFILNSYEECRGPPRLFLLDKFDVAGAGACLKRYTDPSFFKMEWASTELMKAEKAQREKKARRVKKKGRKRRNGETTDVIPVNGRVRYSSLDLNRPKNVLDNLVNTSNQKLKSKEYNKSPLLNKGTKRDNVKGPLNMASPQKDEHILESFSCKFDKNWNSEHSNASSGQDQVIGRHYVERPYDKYLFHEDSHESSSHELEEKPAIRIVPKINLRDNLTTVSSPDSQSPRIIAEVDEDRMSQNVIHAEQKDVLVDDERKQEVKMNEDQNDDVASEGENYMDALTTMESEMETDSESRTKHEVDLDFNSEHKGRALHERPAQYSEFADAEAAAFYNCDSSDESSKVENPPGFLNNKPADVPTHVESTSYTVNSTSECDSAYVDLNRRVNFEPVSVGTSKEDSGSAFDEGSSLSSEVLKNVQVPLDEKIQSDSDVTAEEEMLNGDVPPAVADAISHVITDSVKTNNFVNREFFPAFENNDDTDDFPNVATSAGIDNGEMSFRFPTSEPSLIGTDELQSPPHKEPVAECFEGTPAGANLQISSPKVHKDEDYEGYPVFTSNINVASANSELAAGIENGVTQDNYECIDSQTNNVINGVPEPIKNEASDTQHVQVVNGCSSPDSVGKISVECDVNVKHTEFTTESKPQDPVHSESIGSSMPSKFIDYQVSTGRGLDCVPSVKSAMDVGENGEPPDDMWQRETLKFIAGLQENDLEESKCTESILDVSPINLPPQSNVPDAYRDEQVTENYSSNRLPTEASTVCSGEKLTATSDGTKLVEKDISGDIPMKEVNNDSEDLVAIDAATVKFPVLDFISENDCRKVLSDEISGTETSSNGGVRPDASPHSISTELCSDGSFEKSVDIEPPSDLHCRAPTELSNSGSFEKGVDIEPPSDLHCRAPTELSNSPPSTNSYSEKVDMNSLHVESDMQILYAIPPVKPNTSPHSISIKHCSDGGSFENDVDIESCQNFHLEMPADVFSSLPYELSGAETSINGVVLPDASPHSRSTELCSDGSLEKGVDIEQPSDLCCRAPTELSNSLPFTNSFSEKVDMNSLHAESDMQILYAIPPVKPNASPHSMSIKQCNDGGSFENDIHIESCANVHLETPADVFSSSPSANSFLEKVHRGTLHAESDMQILHAIPPVKPVGAELHVPSPSNSSNIEVLDGEPPSPPLEHIKISFPHTSDSPLSIYSTSSDHVSEFPSPKRHRFSQRETDELSSFHLLPEPAIPLQQTDENSSIPIMGSLSSHKQRKSPETLSNKMHISQMRDTGDDSEDESLKEFGKSTPEISNEFYIQSLESTEGLAVFSGRTAVSDVDTGSPGVLSTTSTTISSSPETTKNSLVNLKCSSADAGSSSSHSRNISLGSSPRSPIVSAPSSPISQPDSPISMEGTRHKNQDLYRIQSPVLESEALDPTSSTLEPNSECNWHDILPPPPEVHLKNQDLSGTQSSALVLTSSTIESNPEGNWHEILPSPPEAHLKNQDLSWSQSFALVPTSSTIESNSEGNWHEMPPHPPLPPLEWRMMMPRQMPTLPLLEGVEPPIPPALPPTLFTNCSMQDASPSSVPAIQKVSIERNDSLIEAIASHDKTTLKKVPKQIHLISEKPIDEREVLLEQIRTRSFNLRRTSVVKKNIPRPVTNINVAAILEKANAIRQAFAGSDEDDEGDEDWSDA